jgi:uncharacterized protein YbcV (DUF1398 family)
MFSTDDIKAAHSKVKSGADFPAYIREIKSLGVTHYETYVTDGHIDYHGTNEYSITVPARYNPLQITLQPDKDAFKAALSAHQRGNSDFLTFIHQCATLGIEKWEISMSEMTCTYFDVSGQLVLVETIPQ